MTKHLSFAERLVQARELRGLTQAEVGKRSGLASSAVSHFETGERRPNLANLVRIADALSVSTDYLLGRTNLPQTDPQDDPLWLKIGLLSSHARGALNAFVSALLQNGGGR